MPKKKEKNSLIPRDLRLAGANDQHLNDLWAFEHITNPKNKIPSDTAHFYSKCMIEEHHKKSKEVSSWYELGNKHHFYSNPNVHKGPRTDRDQMLLPGLDWGF
jgi:hypothetical protein